MLLEFCLLQDFHAYLAKFNIATVDVSIWKSREESSAYPPAPSLLLILLLHEIVRKDSITFQGPPFAHADMPGEKGKSVWGVVLLMTEGFHGSIRGVSRCKKRNRVES